MLMPREIQKARRLVMADDLMPYCELVADLPSLPQVVGCLTVND
jgi:hypothetical protein